MNFETMNIDQKINLKMASLITHYVLTKHPKLRVIIPTNLKGKARYNTCYDLVRPTVPVSEVNKYINEGSERVKTYIKNNIASNKYLKVEFIGTMYGLQVKHGLINELPQDYQDLERTGHVKFVDVKDVEIRE